MRVFKSKSDEKKNHSIEIKALGGPRQLPIKSSNGNLRVGT